MAEHDAAGGLDGPEWSDGGVRFAARDRIDEVVEAFTQRFGKHEFAEEAERRRLPWASVDGPSDLAGNPQLNARGFFVDVEVGLGSSVRRDIGFAVHGNRPLDSPLRVDEAPDPWPEGSTAAPATPSSAPALQGVRVLDLTWVLAGPYATKILADHGADVIKVESRHRPDPTRFSGSMHLTAGGGDGPPDPDRSGYFNNFNRNKRGIVLNLRTPEGLALLARLVPHCDVIVENFSAGLLERWGLGFDELRALRPDVILVRMAGMGQTGPWRDRVTYADALAAAAGITAETGSTAEDPVGVAFGLGDMVAAVHAVAGTLEALDHRDRTGEGREIDLSQLEAMASHTGTALLEYEAGIPSLSYDGNRHPRMAPHGAYPCEGEDRWVAIATAGDDQWRSLCAVIGRRELADDARFATLPDRKANEDELDAVVGEWSRGRSHVEAAEMLQAAGVAAAPVEDGRDLVDGDEHLRARGFYVSLDHPAAGPMLHEGVAVRLAATPGGVFRPAPLLGEHTAEVLTELLGMSQPELDELAAAGVLE